MSTYLFITGKHPYLSIAELQGRYADTKIVSGGDGYVVIETINLIDQQEFDRLGGFIKAAEIIGETEREKLVPALAEVLGEMYTGTKLDYGVSVYGMPEKSLRNILLRLKDELKKSDIKSRFINNRFMNISSAQYKSIRDKGAEIIILNEKENFFICKTVGSQDIDSYSRRDYDKPFRSMKMGMLPPKLAQIMINISGTKGVVWDPFCGSGTVLMEGLLMGRQMMGSDIKSEHVDGAKKNIEWLINYYELGIKNYELFVHDATQPTKKHFDSIVFEGDLGMPHTQMLPTEKILGIMRYLDDLYLRFFSNLKSMKCKAPIVCALPFFRLNGGREMDLSNTISKIEKLGFKKSEIMKPFGKTAGKTVLKYFRDDQAVGRDIYMFRVI